MRTTARFFILIVVLLITASIACILPTSHGDPVGDLVVKATVFPIEGDSPLRVDLYANYSWVNGIGAPVDFYIWTQNGDTVSTFQNDTIIIEEAGIHNVCILIGNIDWEAEAKDCKTVTVR